MVQRLRRGTLFSAIQIVAPIVSVSEAPVVSVSGQFLSRHFNGNVVAQDEKSKVHEKRDRVGLDPQTGSKAQSQTESNKPNVWPLNGQRSTKRGSIVFPFRVTNTFTTQLKSDMQAGEWGVIDQITPMCLMARIGLDQDRITFTMKDLQNLEIDSDFTSQQNLEIDVVLPTQCEDREQSDQREIQRVRSSLYKYIINQIQQQKDQKQKQSLKKSECLQKFFFSKRAKEKRKFKQGYGKIIGPKIQRYGKQVKKILRQRNFYQGGFDPSQPYDHTDKFGQLQVMFDNLTMSETDSSSANQKRNLNDEETFVNAYYHFFRKGARIWYEDDEQLKVGLNEQRQVGQIDDSKTLGQAYLEQFLRLQDKEIETDQKSADPQSRRNDQRRNLLYFMRGIRSVNPHPLSNSPAIDDEMVQIIRAVTDSKFKGNLTILIDESRYNKLGESEFALLRQGRDRDVKNKELKKQWKGLITSIEKQHRTGQQMQQPRINVKCYNSSWIGDIDWCGDITQQLLDRGYVPTISFTPEISLGSHKRVTAEAEAGCCEQKRVFRISKRDKPFSCLDSYILNYNQIFQNQVVKDLDPNFISQKFGNGQQDENQLNAFILQTGKQVRASSRRIDEVGLGQNRDMDIANGEMITPISNCWAMKKYIELNGGRVGAISNTFNNPGIHTLEASLKKFVQRDASLNKMLCLIGHGTEYEGFDIGRLENKEDIDRVSFDVNERDECFLTPQILMSWIIEGYVANMPGMKAGSRCLTIVVQSCHQGIWAEDFYTLMKNQSQSEGFPKNLKVNIHQASSTNELLSDSYFTWDLIKSLTVQDMKKKVLNYYYEGDDYEQEGDDYGNREFQKNLIPDHALAFCHDGRNNFLSANEQSHRHDKAPYKKRKICQIQKEEWQSCTETVHKFRFIKPSRDSRVVNEDIGRTWTSESKCPGNSRWQLQVSSINKQQQTDLYQGQQPGDKYVQVLQQGEEDFKAINMQGLYQEMRLKKGFEKILSIMSQNQKQGIDSELGSKRITKKTQSREELRSLRGQLLRRVQATFKQHQV